MFKALIASIFLMFLSTCSCQILQGQQKGGECIDSPTSKYTGTLSRTRNGITCQRWDVTSPHIPKRTPFDGGHHNYCRNPDKDPRGPWCYTTDPSQRWDYCNISICADDSLVVWTDMKNSSANILAMEANPDTIRERLSSVSKLNVSVLADSGKIHSEYADVTGSYMEKTIFYADSVSNCVVMTNLDTKLTSNHLHGIATNIKSVAYDWMRQNLYWIDDVMDKVMVADPTLTFYTSVYPTNQGKPRALTLHSSQKNLFFSLYKPLRSLVVRTDLAGKNQKVVFRFPQIFDVTSLTLDHTDNRLYLADYWGHGSLVKSSDLNGGAIRRHYFSRGSKFMGISAYMDYIYMTDSLGRYDNGGEYVHSMWLKSKSGVKTFRYNFDGEPRGMKILSSKEENMNAALDVGDCLTMPPCDHVCLPRVDTVRECACATGYVKSGDTGCVMVQNFDHFLLTVDQPQQALFQLPFGRDQNVARMELENHPQLSVVAADPINARLWLVNTAASSIEQHSLDGRMTPSVPVPSKPNSLAVDHMTGNLYFSDVISQSIYVTSSSGRTVREVVASDVGVTSDIQMITLDLRLKKIYWTNTNNAVGRGEVWRADMSGGNKERVICGLHWPRAITIDYQRRSLFVGEAKRMLVYEVPLSSIVNVSNHESITNITHDLRDTASRRSSSDNHVIDMEVRNGTLYFLEEHQIKQFDLTTGAHADLSSPDFYHLTSLAMYDTQYLRQFTDSFDDPCRDVICPLLCLPTSPSSHTCS